MPAVGSPAVGASPRRAQPPPPLAGRGHCGPCLADPARPRMLAFSRQVGTAAVGGLLAAAIRHCPQKALRLRAARRACARGAAVENVSELIQRACVAEQACQGLPSEQVSTGPAPRAGSQGRAQGAARCARELVAPRGRALPEEARESPRGPLGRLTSEQVARLAVALADGGDVAFLFVKPHANFEEGRQCTKELLARSGVRVVAEGKLTALEMDRDRVIDKHYRSLAAKAMDLCPRDLVVQPEATAAFEAAFGRSWAEALASECVCNAREAMERLDLDEQQLGIKWAPLKLNEGKVKFGGGFYCGKIDSLFVVNGFYMAMRDAYTRPGKSVHWYVVEWKAADTSWGEFRQNVLGATHPEDAVPGSLRGYFRDHWRSLGLRGPLHVGENAVHASASAFEAMVERVNWLGISFEDDPLGRELIRSHVPVATLKSWSSDPVVSHDGREASLFDLFENLGCSESIELATALLRDGQPAPSLETQ
ncbi:unnamed protein product [Prorocentrum cordatum]|uniref:Nucleoside-diphosphate kinase n=1 Tax=Prorocentrum cordatum TaxID=2364126 RepID=A0ABN9VVA6_9DINO|nr:unnamed protein product [Polarella glacialis]